MRIDVLDKTHFRLFEDDLKKALGNLHKELQTLKREVRQLQDRIKMLEDKNEKEM